MYRLRNFRSPVLADAAARFLRAHGVLASVTPDGIAEGVHYAYTLVLALESQRPDAEALLEELRDHPPQPEEGWEAAATPDLSRLDPALLPDCPACGARLPADPALDRCPACRAEADVCALLASAHGPELLADLMDSPDAPAAGTPTASPAPKDTADTLPEDLLVGLPLGCETCNADLRGLPVTGRCPVCGAPFDKRAIAASLLEADRD